MPVAMKGDKIHAQFAPRRAGGRDSCIVLGEVKSAGCVHLNTITATRRRKTLAVSTGKNKESEENNSEQVAAKGRQSTHLDAFDMVLMMLMAM